MKLVNDSRRMGRPLGAVALLGLLLGALSACAGDPHEDLDTHLATYSPLTSQTDVLLTGNLTRDANGCVWPTQDDTDGPRYAALLPQGTRAVDSGVLLPELGIEKYGESFDYTGGEFVAEHAAAEVTEAQPSQCVMKERTWLVVPLEAG